MTVVSKALVIGGGIGGLTAAIALRQQGIAVDLVEVAPNLSVYGVGIIQPNNALRAFDRVGLAQACIEAGAAFPGWQICSSKGDLLMAAPSPTSAAPHLPAVNGITRPRLHKILTDAAYDSGAVIHLGETVSDLAEVDGAVVVTFRGGRKADYDLVIAADGLLSDMRRRYFPQVGEPKFTGQGVWRYNLPRPSDMEWGSIHFGAGSKVGLVPLSPDTMYMFVVTAEPGNPWYQGDGLAQIMRSRLSDYEGPIAELARLITDPAGVVYKPMHNVLMPGPWNSGRVVFIGDAAHATTPHLAQGAAMAVEDAVLLAGLLGEGEDIAQVLAQYVSRRLPRARYVVDVSTQLADWELEAWGGVQNPKADPGGLLHDATVKLMDDF